MGIREFKLIHFDSSYYAPSPVPLTEIDYSDKNNQSKGLVDLAHLRSLFREINRDDLIRFVKSAPTSCEICNIYLNNFKDLISHVFSQPHMDKYTQIGQLSRRDAAFWIGLLKIFVKDGTRVSHQERHQQQKQELHLISVTLDLPSRTTHWTVEVSSADEQEKALCHFASTCFSESQRIVVCVANTKESVKMKKLILSTFPGSRHIPISNSEDDEHSVYIEGPHGPDSAGLSMVYLRPPPVNGGAEKALDYVYSIRHCMNSMILVNGSEEKAAFRVFEKKVSHSDEAPPFPIYNLTELQNFMKYGMARCGPRPGAKPPATVSQAPVKKPLDATVLARTTVSAGFYPWYRISTGYRIRSKTTKNLKKGRKMGPAESLYQNDSEADTESLVSTAALEKEEPATVPSTPNLKLVVRKGKKYYEEVKKSVPNQEEWMDNIPTINEDEVNECPKFSVFVPFDDKTRKDVKEIIEMMIVWK